MRPNVDTQKIERLMQALGRDAKGSGCIYFTGGALSPSVRNWTQSNSLLLAVLMNERMPFATIVLDIPESGVDLGTDSML